MNPRLKCIMLIDDNEADNCYHEMVIEGFQCSETVVCQPGAQEGLDYLKGEDSKDHPQPDLIFLDINMPGMNGWEFLDAYSELGKTKKGQYVVVMLTTSLNQDDRQKADGDKSIKDFCNKPLTEEMLKNIVEVNFPEVKFGE